MKLAKQIEVGHSLAGFELESHGANVEILLDAAGEEADFALDVERRVEGQDPVHLRGNVRIRGQHDRSQPNLLSHTETNQNVLLLSEKGAADRKRRPLR